MAKSSDFVHTFLLVNGLLLCGEAADAASEVRSELTNPEPQPLVSVPFNHEVVRQAVTDCRFSIETACIREINELVNLLESRFSSSRWAWIAAVQLRRPCLRRKVSPINDIGNNRHSRREPCVPLSIP